MDVLVSLYGLQGEGADGWGTSPTRAPLFWDNDVWGRGVAGPLCPGY